MPQNVKIPYTVHSPTSEEPYATSVAYTDVEIATEEELLEFCNRVREAGGADILEALLPSRPGNAHECLIANALNFGCSVRPVGEKRNGLFDKWKMDLPSNLTDEQAAAISEVVGSPVVGRRYSGVYRHVDLPPHIGNAAHAFDEGVAFSDLAKER